MRADALARQRPRPVQGEAATAPVVTVETAGGEWDRFVEAEEGTSGYHAWAWRHVFERAFGHEPIYLAARRDGCIVGVLPLVFMESFLFGRALVSLPFVNYGGIAASDDAAARALLARAAALMTERKCRSLELRHVSRRFDDLPFKSHKVGMYLALPSDAGVMWDQLDRKVRNQVRKAQKAGLTAQHGGAELVDAFYSVFARNMRDLGTPVYSRRLFEEVIAALEDRICIHVVRMGDMPVAGAITFRTRHTVEVPWASSLREHNALCPNTLLYWSVIERAIANGCSTVDFGRSTPDEGTFKFKRQWGAQPVSLHWEYHVAAGAPIPNTSPANPKFKAAIAIWKRLPVAATNVLGPLIVRSIP